MKSSFRNRPIFNCSDLEKAIAFNNTQFGRGPSRPPASCPGGFTTAFGARPSQPQSGLYSIRSRPSLLLGNFKAGDRIKKVLAHDGELELGSKNNV